MSYILDALRKSEQQRQHGKTPTLASAPPSGVPTAAKPAGRLPLLLLALALLVAGIAIGWLRPWQVPSQPAPAIAEALMPAPSEPAPAAQVAEEASTRPALAAPPIIAPPPPPPTAAVAPAPTAAAMPTPLPTARVVTGKPALPAISITVHAYAPNPKERLASINGKLVQEGEEVSPGLRLEKITEDGVLLNYQGQRFRRQM
mgnify:CR=1 FL=1